MKEEETYEFYREQTLLLTEEYKKLNQRIDKAVEKIESYRNILWTEYDEELLNILKGEDK